MSRPNGFALLTVLWLLLLLSVLLGDALVPVATSLRATENRVLLKRAQWAALGCLELARARLSVEGGSVVLDSIALGPGVWCATELLNADERVNPNQGDSVGLGRVLEDEVRVASLLDWVDGDDAPRRGGAERAWYHERGRPGPRNDSIRSAGELRLVRGFEDVSAEVLDGAFTARGDGRVSPNRAPARVLASISVLTPNDLSRIVGGGRTRPHFVSAEQLVSVAEIDLGIDEFRELTRRVSFTESVTMVRLRGRTRAGARTLDYAAVAVLHRTPTGPAVVGLEVEE